MQPLTEDGRSRGRGKQGHGRENWRTDLLLISGMSRDLKELMLNEARKVRKKGGFEGLGQARLHVAPPCRVQMPCGVRVAAPEPLGGFPLHTFHWSHVLDSHHQPRGAGSLADPPTGASPLCCWGGLEMRPGQYVFCGAEMVFGRRGDRRACIVMHDDQHMSATCRARVQHGNSPSLPEGCCRVAREGPDPRRRYQKRTGGWQFCVLPSLAAGRQLADGPQQGTGGDGLSQEHGARAAVS